MADIEKNDLLEFWCGICYKLYGDEVVPLILLCGHTYCQQCIVELDNTSKLCPTCRTPMSGNSSIKNFSHLSLVTQLKGKYLKDSYITELENLKSHIQTNKEHLIKSRDLHNKHLKALGGLFGKVHNVLKKHETSSEEIIPDFIHNIKATLSSIHRETKEIKFIPKIFVHPSNDPCSYLIKIYKKIQSGEKLLTVHLPNYESGFKYGRISIWSNVLYFHSLSLNDPEDCHEYIKFDDLKDIVASKKINTNYKFRPFLKLRTKTDVEHIISIIAMNCILTPQFIRLCTGESGFSYKGGEYEYNRTDPSIVLKGYNDEPEINFGNVDYCPDTFECVSAPAMNQYLVAGNRNGGFKIYYSAESFVRKDCVGRIEYPPDLLANVYKSGKVVDCGVSFKVF